MMNWESYKMYIASIPKDDELDKENGDEQLETMDANDLG